MLIPADQGPLVAGLRVPDGPYCVLRAPGPLAEMRLPGPTWPWRAIHDGGVSDLVSLRPCSFDPGPLTKVFADQLEDLVSGGPPRKPEREVSLIRAAVGATMESLQAGRGVVVHCRGDRGRTGTVLGCVLRELGDDGDAVVGYLNAVDLKRGKEGWPESSL